MEEVTKKDLNKKEKELDKKEKELTRKEKIFQKTKKSAKKFKNEFNKSINTAILAAFGFLVALVWKDVITEAVNKLTAFSPVQGKLLSAIIITLVCVMGIMIIAKLLPYEK